MDEEMTDDPEAQLEILAAEIVRQREENARRQGNMHSRAGVLVAAAGIVTGLHLQHPTLWLILPALLAAATAVLGLIVLLARHRDEPAVKQTDVDGLRGRTTFQVRYTIAKDNVTAITQGRKLLDDKAKLVNVGYVLLAATWTTQIIVTITAN